MCRIPVDIQSATAEIRRGKNEKKQDQNILFASATQVGHKNKMLRRNGPVIKPVKSVLRPKESLWSGGLKKEVGFEPGVKERGSYGCESGELIE